jgi:hypothetical protein
MGPVDAYVGVYMALDHVWAARAMPSDCFAMVHKAIERLRSTAAPRDDVDLAERIAVIFHRIEWSRRTGAGNEEESARTELKRLGQAWMQRQIRQPAAQANA